MPVRLFAQIILLGSVTLSAWSFGGIQAWSQSALLISVAVVIVLWLLTQIRGGGSWAAVPWETLPLLGVLAIGAFQLLPLAPQAARWLSPQGTHLRHSLISASPISNAPATDANRVPFSAAPQPISLYPAATRRTLALLVFGVAVFLGGAMLFRDPRPQLWLCATIAVNGAVYAFFENAQRLLHAAGWRAEWVGRGIQFFGPFVNRNHAAAFLNLSIAAAVGMAFWAATRAGPRSACADDGPLGAGRGRAFLRKCLPRLDGRNWTAQRVLALALGAFMAAGILCSLSRGGTMAMLAGLAVTCLASRGRERRAHPVWLLVFLLLAGALLVGWVGMSAAVQDRLGTLADRDELARGRIAHWRDASAAIADFWRLGSGLGTYAYVYLPYQQRLDQAWYYHAENTYLEALVVGGIPTLALMLAAIVMVACACRRTLRLPGDLRTQAFALAVVFALTSQVVHALCDFALFMPANLGLLAVFTGALAGAGGELPIVFPTPGLVARRYRRALAIALGASLFVATCWAGNEMQRFGYVEAALRSTRVAASPATPASTYTAALQEMATAQQRYPDDAESHYRTAELWLGLYRVKALEQMRKERIPAADDVALWRLTGPLVIRGRACDCAHDHQPGQLERLRQFPLVRKYLHPALREAEWACRGCPLLVNAHLLIAELACLTSDFSNDAILVNRARQLEPANPEVRFCCGVMELQARRADLAYADWRKAMELEFALRREILLLADGKIAVEDLVGKVLPRSPRLLLQMAREDCAAPQFSQIRRQILRRAEDLLPQTVMPDAERYYLQGATLALEQRDAEAIDHYRRAIALSARNVAWRYELAMLLMRKGLLDEAHAEAVICIRFEPENREYARFLEELNHQLIAGPPTFGATSSSPIKP
jgi:O-antigen ligase